MTREEAIVILKDIYDYSDFLPLFDDCRTPIEMAIEALKRPERANAHWIKYERAHYFKCSRCKLPVPYKKAMLHNGARIYDYCPSCGAKMDEEATQ